MLKITDEQLIQELLNRIEENKKNLEELQKLNKVLTRVNNKLTESEEMKSHFISNISNEIINPFTSILALSRTILEVKKENWKKVNSMVALIHNEAFNLDFQLRNIFAAAKIEAGEIYPEITQIDIKGLINEVIHVFKYISKKNKITIRQKINLPSINNREYSFKTDCEKLQLIITNLLSNAIKFSETNGVVEIVCNISKSGILEFRIMDYGTGISKENQEIIFDRFTRLDSGINSLNRGHGLGLSVIKAFIELLEGNIKVKSEIGKGATFIVQIPESKLESEGYTIDGNELIFEEEIF